MLQNPCKTLGFKKNMVYKIPPGGGGKPYPASGLKIVVYLFGEIYSQYKSTFIKSFLFRVLFIKTFLFSGNNSANNTY